MLDSDETTHVLNLGFNLSFYALKEGSKDLKKRIACHNAYMKLNNNEPFDTFKAQLLIRIDKYFTPRKLNIANYLILFSIPRISPMPMTLAKGEDYQLLLERIAKAKGHTCAIYVQEIVDDQAHRVRNIFLWNSSFLMALRRREGRKIMKMVRKMRTTSRTKTREQRKRRSVAALRLPCFFVIILSQPPKSADIHTANIPHNDNIKVLRGQWMCHKKPGCESEHCYINPVDSSHLALSHSHFDVWAAAMVCTSHRLIDHCLFLIANSSKGHILHHSKNPLPTTSSML